MNEKQKKLIEDIKQFYKKPGNEVGGALHIFLEDGNIEDGHIKFCIEQAKKINDQDAIDIAEQLLALNLQGRNYIYKRIWWTY